MLESRTRASIVRESKAPAASPGTAEVSLPGMLVWRHPWMSLISQELANMLTFTEALCLSII